MLTWLFFFSKKAPLWPEQKEESSIKSQWKQSHFITNSVNRHNGAPQKRPEHHGTLIVLLVGIGITTVDALDAPGRFLGTPVSIAILANFPKDV